MSEREELRRLIVGDGETRIDSFDAADRILAAGWQSPAALAASHARVVEMEAALREIADIAPRPANTFPDDWREQIAACPECQRYADHPIQRGICNDHRKPIYARDRHDDHEEKALGYRAKGIARDALRAALTQETDHG